MFADDDSIGAATVHAAKTLCSRNELLISAVCENKKNLVWMVRAMNSHSNHDALAIGACDTISSLVANNRHHAKLIRKTNLCDAMSAILDLHSDNEKVIIAALNCIKAMTSFGEKANKIFCVALQEKDCLQLLDAALKEHQGKSKQILELGLGVRAKLTKYEPAVEAPDPRLQARLGAGRRASLSVFALPPPSMAVSGKQEMATLAEEGEEEDEEEDAFAQLTRDLMADMFQIRQSHIKRAPKLVQLQVGSMGLTFYDKDMKPLENIMYMNLNSWTATPKSVDLFIADKSKKGGLGRKTVLKVDTADQAHSIVTLMETKATELAAQHKKKRKFDVKQTHLPAAVSALVQLQVGQNSILLYDGEKIVHDIIFSTVESWERTRNAEDERTLVLHLQDGESAIKLTTDKVEAIMRLLDDCRVTSGEVVEAPDAEPEVQIQPEPEIEEGVPPEQEVALGTSVHDDDEAAAEQEQEDSEDDEDEDAEDMTGSDEENSDFTVIQESARGARTIQISISKDGLLVSDKGDTVLYSYTNIRTWSSVLAQSCTIFVSAGAGFLTGFTFKTPESALLCKRLQKCACEVARMNLLSQLAGSSSASPYEAKVGTSDADLTAKLQALQKENQQLAEARAKAEPMSAVGGGVNAEMVATLKATQEELQSVKAKLAAARKTQKKDQQKKQAETSDGSESTDRIIELEQLTVTQAKELANLTARVAKSEESKDMQQQIKKAQAEIISWKLKAETAQKLAKSMETGDGAAVLSEMTTANDQLNEQVEQLKIKMLQVGKEAKKSQKAMEAMKKQREKESALVIRAMGELKSLRGEIKEKDSKISKGDAQFKKAMAMLKDMKTKHATELEAVKLTHA